VSTAKLLRTVRNEKIAPTLFEVEPSWKDHWWAMPEFSMGDARPRYKITLNFMTAEDVAEFSKATGLPVTVKSDSAWYPHQEPLRGQFYWDGPPMGSRYPVCIPSKGRADCQKTGNALERMGVPHKFFVEETEYEDYCKHLGEDRVVSMPFHDLGQGSIPARNFIWEWAKERGCNRHWTVDDNIVSFYRCTNNRRLRVLGGGFFRAMEDWVDRYENIAMAGPHDIAFVGDRDPSLTPFLLNSRVYSCILLDTRLPERWRGRYNEDTDLSLRLLKDGHCTALFRALCMDKPGTAGSKSAAMKGGNTDNVYNTDDKRLAFARSLQEQHPDCVEVAWKFNRWHHQVDYSQFKKNALRFNCNVTPDLSVDDYGMILVSASEEAET
jgi:hypothetical protein